MQTQFANLALTSPTRIAMPIGVYAGLAMTGASVRDAVSNADAQVQAVLAMSAQFHSHVLLTAMDLSAEAETFGCTIRMAEDEIPTVLGRRVTNAADIAALPAPQPGDARTRVHLDAAQKLVAHANGVPVLGGLIGPFSLAGRLFGVSELLELTLTDPALTLKLLARATQFLSAYARAFQQVGAQGVIMAEPAAGLLSPRGLAKFSAPFVKQIISETQTAQFVVVLHNCGAKLVHLPKILESGAEIYHFGAPMDLLAALQQVNGTVILAGNLDPSAVFHAGTPESVRMHTAQLAEATRAYRNVIISSGCDLPPGTAVENLQAFYDAVAANA